MNYASLGNDDPRHPARPAGLSGIRDPRTDREWLVASVTRLTIEVGRAVAFSAAIRNSLVVLPLALAVPGAIPALLAVIVTQTLVKLLAELIYIRISRRIGVATVP